MKYKENMISVQFIYVLQHVIHVLHQFNRPFFSLFFLNIFLFFSFPLLFFFPLTVEKNFAFPPHSFKKISRPPLFPEK